MLDLNLVPRERCTSKLLVVEMCKLCMSELPINRKAMVVDSDFMRTRFWR